MCAIAFIVCMILGGLFAHYLTGKINRNNSAGKINRNNSIVCKIMLTIMVGAVLYCFVAIAYLCAHYHTDSNVDEQAYRVKGVEITSVEGGYFFDGPSDSKAIIFYPGAKVDERAYIPLMATIASEGVDCFITRVPFNMAIFDADKADWFIDNYSYSDWFVAGHSMGGVVATDYANDHQDVIDGIILLASFPNEDVCDDISLCSVYGSEDGCLEMDSYMENKKYWPSVTKELCIEGGNHAQFGNYGLQKGDGIATIDNDTQQKLTADFVVNYVMTNDK